jgi:NOL1/NOP2/fmu family ribosome biogenesis protein
MQKLKFLNSREKKELFKQLKEQFDCNELDMIFLENSQSKIFALSKDYAKADLEKVNVNNLGLYFAKKEREGIRLSIEGAQMVNARKNIIELNKEQANLWMKGEDITMEGNSGFVIIKSDNDIFGCGMLRNNILRNMVPKERRLTKISEYD